MNTRFGFWKDISGAKLMKQDWVLALGLTILLTVTMLLTTERFTYTHPDFSRIADHQKYMEMARAPFTFHIAPFCWRILMPLLAYLISLFGVDIQWAFLLINILGIGGTAIVLYNLIKLMGYSAEYGAIGIMLFYSFGWATRYPLNAWLPDALSFSFISLAIYFIFAGKDLYFALTVAVGVMVKESVFFVIPLYYTVNSRRLIDIKVFFRMVLLASPAILVGIGIRLAIPAWNNDLGYLSSLPDELKLVQLGTSSYGFIEAFRLVGYGRLLNYDYLKIATVGTFGFWGMTLPLFAVRENLKVLIKFSPFIVLVIAQLLVAVNNQRLIVVAFLPLIIMCINGWRVICNKLGIHAVTLFIPIAYGLIQMLLMSSNTYVYMPSPNRDVLIFTGLLAWAFQLSIKKQALP